MKIIKPLEHGTLLITGIAIGILICMLFKP